MLHLLRIVALVANRCTVLRLRWVDNEFLISLIVAMVALDVIGLYGCQCYIVVCLCCLFNDCSVFNSCVVTVSFGWL